jgi:preprotein translocase subunit YajC
MKMLFVLLMGPTQPGQNPLFSFIPLILIIVVFYFFMIRPQMKRQKELKNFRESLKKGDKVITTGGIYGRIVEIEDHAILIEVDSNVKIRVDKVAILKDPSDIEAK